MAPSSDGAPRVNVSDVFFREFAGALGEVENSSHLHSGEQQIRRIEIVMHHPARRGRNPGALSAQHSKRISVEAIGSGAPDQLRMKRIVGRGPRKETG